jgi:hypothetical protein
MKKWWNKTPGEFWMDLLRREKTRWLAGVLFICGTVFANWMVMNTALEGKMFARFGGTVSVRDEPLLFSFWLTWRTAFAVILDSILLWIIIASLRDKKKPIQASQPIPLKRHG